MQINRVDNQTHWKTQDILHIARSAVTAAGISNMGCDIDVAYARRATVDLYQRYSRATGEQELQILITLPRRGPREHHSNPLYAMAAEGLSADNSLLSLQLSWEIANRIYWRACAIVTGEWLHGNKPIWDAPPTWGPPAETLIIRKVVS